MNFSKIELRDLKDEYEMLTWVITKRKLEKKISPLEDEILKIYNTILDLIEDLEEKQ